MYKLAFYDMFLQIKKEMIGIKGIVVACILLGSFFIKTENESLFMIVVIWGIFFNLYALSPIPQKLIYILPVQERERKKYLWGRIIGRMVEDTLLFWLLLVVRSLGHKVQYTQMGIYFLCCYTPYIIMICLTSIGQYFNIKAKNAYASIFFNYAEAGSTGKRKKGFWWKHVIVIVTIIYMSFHLFSFYEFIELSKITLLWRTLLAYFLCIILLWQQIDLIKKINIDRDCIRKSILWNEEEGEFMDEYTD